MNVVTHLLSHANRDAVAIIAGQQEMTYGELLDQMDQVAITLSDCGRGGQDRIAIWSENSPFFVASYLGVIRAGMVAVPLQTDTSAESLKFILKEVEAETILASQKHLTQLHGWHGGTNVLILGEREALNAPRGVQPRSREIDSSRDLAALMFTSGSTGKPKGVMVTHRNIACNTRDITNYMGLRPDDRAMVVLPFHYCYGLSILHTHLAVGGSVVLNNSFVYPEKVLQEMRSRECTGLAGVPSTYQFLLRKSRFKHLEFPRLRWLQQAGGKLPNALIEEIVSAFPNVRFYLMYGQTEGTARLSYLPPEHLRDKLGSIGRGLPSTRLEVLRPDGTPVTPGSGEVGEIAASGENITLGYWNDPEETARYFRDGKLFTGDLASVDVDGFIYVVEREREMIKCGGHRVSAKEVEDVIAQIPDVVEVAIVGAPHEILGEAGVAFVVLKQGIEGRDSIILDYCRRKLPSYKVPQRIILMQRLPHGSNGKVLKSRLKEMAHVGESHSKGVDASGDGKSFIVKD